MPADLFGHRVFGVGEHAFAIDNRLQVVPVVITQMNFAQIKRRGLDEPEIVINYLAEPRKVIAAEFKTYGSIDAEMVHATAEEAHVFKDTVIRERFTPRPTSVTHLQPGVMLQTTPPVIKLRKRK